MSTELYKELAQRGVDPRGLHLVAFGGAGPTQAALLAEEARLAGIVVPLSPGTFCALGAIQSDVRRDYVRSLRVRIDGGERAVDAVRGALDEMQREALEWVAREGWQLAAPVLRRGADMRYGGQAYDLRVTLPEDLSRETAGGLAERFHAEHARVYGFPDRDSEVEIMNVRLSVSRAMAPVRPPPLAAGEGAPAPRGERAVHVREECFAAAVYAREDLRAGQVLDGPAIVEQADTTVWVLPRWRATVHADGSLVLGRDGARGTRR